MANRGLAKFWDGVNAGKIKIIKHYVEQGANPDITDSGGRTPLHYAAISGYTEVAKYLVSKGAEVNARNNIGLTPLFYAARYDHLDTCRYLLEDGNADIHIEDNDGRTALHLAARFGHPTVCRYLLERGAHPDACDNSGCRADEGENFFANVDEIDRNEIIRTLNDARQKLKSRNEDLKAALAEKGN